MDTVFEQMIAQYRDAKKRVLGDIRDGGAKGIRIPGSADLAIAMALFEAGLVTCDDEGGHWKSTMMPPEARAVRANCADCARSARRKINK